MGLFSDLEANALTIDFELPREGIQRAVVQELKLQQDRLGDIAYPAGFEAVDEVQEIPDAESDDGTYTLTFNLYGGVTFTTAALDHDDNAAAIEAAIDAAAEGVVDGFTAGDIAITGGPIDTNPIVVTYSGDSVSGRPHDLVTVSSSLSLSSDPVAAPTATEEVAGQTNRTPWAILNVLGVLDGTPPAQGTSTDLTQLTNPNINPHYPSAGLIRALAKEAAAQDRNSAVETAILTACGLN